MTNQKSKFQLSDLSFSQLVTCIAVLIVILAGGAADLVQASRGMLGLPNVVVDEAPMLQLRRDLDRHIGISEEHRGQLDRNDEVASDGQKKNLRMINDLRDSLDQMSQILEIHTAQLDTIISMGNRTPSKGDD